jgi:hypothetical protein
MASFRSMAKSRNEPISVSSACMHLVSCTCIAFIYHLHAFSVSTRSPWVATLEHSSCILCSSRTSVPESPLKLALPNLCLSALVFHPFSLHTTHKTLLILLTRLITPSSRITPPIYGLSRLTLIAILILSG